MYYYYYALGAEKTEKMYYSLKRKKKISNTHNALCSLPHLVCQSYLNCPVVPDEVRFQSIGGEHAQYSQLCTAVLNRTLFAGS